MEDSANGRALVERQVLVTQLTTAREVVRVVLAEIGLKTGNPNDFCLCVSDGSRLIHYSCSNVVQTGGRSGAWQTMCGRC